MRHSSALPRGGGMRLIVVSGSSRGTIISLDQAAGRSVVGRSHHCDHLLADPSVSRQHAELVLTGDRATVRDLGSSGGTLVNGHPAGMPTPIRGGDRLRLADVDLIVEDDQSASRTTARAPEAASGGFAVGRQDAYEANNVVGVQHRVSGNQQHIAGDMVVHQMQRESFAAAIAATRTNAWRLVVVGFVATAIGMMIWVYVVLRNMQMMIDSTESESAEFYRPTEFLGQDVAGVPLGAIGLFLALIGPFVLVAGIVLHIVAAARKRQLESS